MEAKQTAEQRSGRKTLIRLPVDQKQAIEKQALDLSARLGIRLTRNSMIQGVIGALLKVKPTDPKAELVMNELQKGNVK